MLLDGCQLLFKEYLKEKYLSSIILKSGLYECDNVENLKFSYRMNNSENNVHLDLNNSSFQSKSHSLNNSLTIVK